MRRSFLTTEVWTSALGMAGIIWLFLGAVPVLFLNILCTVFLCEIMIARAIFKHGRIFFNDPAVLGSGEIIALISNYAITIYSFKRLGLRPVDAIVLIGIGQSVYVLSRAWAKKNVIRNEVRH